MDSLTIGNVKIVDNGQDGIMFRGDKQEKGTPSFLQFVDIDAVKLHKWLGEREAAKEKEGMGQPTCEPDREINVADREVLYVIKSSADTHAHGSASPTWRRAYEDLRQAADHVDAMLARCWDSPKVCEEKKG